MSTVLPVPVRFELPDPAWEALEPDSVGVDNAAFLAVRRGAVGDYVPVITVSGDWRSDDATLAQIADESLAVLRDELGHVELVKRTATGTDEAPAITQLLGGVAVNDGTQYDLRQVEVLTALCDVNEPTRRAVVIYTLICTFAQLEDLAREFQDFVASVEVVEGDGVLAADVP